MSMKQCRICGDWKPNTSEYFKPRDKGTGRLRNECRVCIAEKARMRYAEKHGLQPKPFCSEGYKPCVTCGECKPATSEYFQPRDDGSRDGLRGQCRDCQRIRKNEWREAQPEEYHQRQRERQLAIHHTHMQNDPEYRRARRERSRIYRENNSEKVRLSNRLQKRERRKDPELRAIDNARVREYESRMRDDLDWRNRQRELNRQWTQLRRSDPDYLSRKRLKDRVFASRRRARKRALPSDFTKQDWYRALDYFEHRCAVCGRAPDFWTILAADHWIPLSKGGGTTKDNIVPLCHSKKDAPVGEPSCNLGKHNKLPADWLTERYGEKKAAEILTRIEAYFDFIRTSKV